MNNPTREPRLARFVDGLNERVGRAVSWLTLLMVVVTALVVVLRYAFDVGWIAMQESVTYMHAVVFMLGAAFTLKHHGHVRVDIFYRKLGFRGRAWVDLLGGLVLLLPMSVFIAWVSWDYVASSWQVMEGSREAGGLPGVFLLKALILAMPALMVLQALAGVLRDLLIIRGILVPEAETRIEEVEV
jgi:TRAP-type mannitol/chloroaromatic compound transport system permease small subunit